MDDFKTECDLCDDYGNFNIMERQLEIKLDLLSQKERLTDQKYDQKDAKKSKKVPGQIRASEMYNSKGSHPLDLVR